MIGSEADELLKVHLVGCEASPCAYLQDKRAIDLNTKEVRSRGATSPSRTRASVRRGAS